MIMRLFLDECRSPAFVNELSGLGHDAIHPLQSGRRAQHDHTIVSQCIREDRDIVTENFSDFKKLLGRETIHPGLIALPQTTRKQGLELLLAAISLLQHLADDPMSPIVNSCVEFDARGRPALVALAADMPDPARKPGKR